ncbi:MAG TPA: deoxyribose-phosphate aldolase [Gordonia sp. (in: high G+C Gram-positive bacteria)]|uniref:deoxyribose-phosphate aldolase n=1 Tax=unclassified Gordonia (in: high G+C Gram-positive bacteria) TaxID=2657482 RepID=UPI000FA7BE95|nr:MULTISPECIES: deoxyribose-phosphate aldolase [unclassified Gordonia (in: high G+C Gram-positive bacteria)]RUP39976.1 MAG: deoxyribose-phosphate aldolase [Gordonia sp. (in: high G+C Gram-positive bacteria)]HNP56542.1 deoxyribose-phosphate aldolase [Gordonia sp. (in: high G+C Gram-positive bacteria)]HRC49631.1 deoxyribose-phosphate aldolase [Gordonia sp. (in: high G+C Gram-positive bacteria)]
MTEHDLTRERVARMIDHTLLAPEATRADAEAAVLQAAELDVFAVCLSPSMLPIATGDRQRLAVVAGFPSGKHHALIKAAEARMAVDTGAQEIDMVIDIGAAVDGRFDEVFAEVLTVAQAVSENVLLKVIVESAVLLRDAGPDTLQRVCEQAVAAGAGMVKTSTGFHPAGGASVEAVRLMADAVGGSAGVKASGGIRDARFAAELIEAGATRLGLSQTAAVLDGFGPAAPPDGASLSA